MVIKLFNVNWPADVREKVIEDIKENGGSIRTAKHKDCSSGFYYYYIEVTDCSHRECMLMIQRAFRHRQLAPTSTNTHYSFTYEDHDYVLDNNSIFRVCKSLRNVNISEDVAREACDSFNKCTQRAYYFSTSETTTDLYLTDLSALSDLILATRVTIDLYYKDSSIHEMLYTVDDVTYKYPEMPKMRDKKPVNNYSIDCRQLPVALTDLIISILFWRGSVTAIKIGDCINVAATKSVIIDCCNKAFAVYVHENGDTNNYVLSIDTSYYILSYDYCNVIAVTCMSNIVDPTNLMDKLVTWLDDKNIYSLHMDNKWYIESKYWRMFVNHGRDVVEKNPVEFSWQMD